MSVAITFTPTNGSWPNGEVITPTVSGVAGTFSPTTLHPSGTGAVACTWTPSAAGTASLSSTTSPSMTNTTGAQNYVSSSTVATAYTTTLASSSGLIGAPVTLTFTPTSGVWPNSEVITPTVSGVAGTFSPTTVNASGSGAVSCTFTPSGAGTASLSSTTSPSMTNTTGAQNYVANSSGYTTLSDITWSQPELYGDLLPTTGDNTRPVVGVFTPVGGTGPFQYSMTGQSGVGFCMGNSGGYDAGGGPTDIGWIMAPYVAESPANDTMTLQITDATGASVTKSVTIQRGLTGPAIWLDADRTWPSNITPTLGCYVYTPSSGTVGDTITVTDPSNTWTYNGYGGITTVSGSPPPVGSYPITINSSGSQGNLSLTATLTITAASISPMIFVQTMATVSTSILQGTVIGHINGTTPRNGHSFALTDNTGTLQINTSSGIISLKAQPASTGPLSFTVTETEGTILRTDTFSISIAQGTTVPATNMTMVVNQNLLNDAVGQTVGTPSVTGVTGTHLWTLVDHTGKNDFAVANGSPDRFTIDASTGVVTAPKWLSADVDGTSARTYSLVVSCTDGINTCTQTFTCSVAWAPVSQTYYVGRGMSTAHPGSGYETIAACRHDLVSVGDYAPHSGTWHILIYADTDVDYYADDTGTKTGDYACRFPWSGPIVIEGVAASGVSQPRTGGKSSNNSSSGGDMRGKGFWVFGHGDAVLKNIEVAYCHGPDSTHSCEAIRKDGNCYGNMSVINCYIHDCDQGAMAGEYGQSDYLIDHTEIANCGTAHESAGAQHNIYIAENTSSIIRNSVSWRSTCGHDVKVRSMSSKIYNNRFFDGIGGSASNVVDICNGGQTEIYNNYIQKGPMAQNPDCIRIGEDLWKQVWQTNVISIHDNTFDIMTMEGNHWGTPVAVGHFPTANLTGTVSSVSITNNSVWLYPNSTSPMDLVWRNYDGNAQPTNSFPNATTESGTTVRSLPITLDTSRPYLSGTLPTQGPLYRVTQWGGDTLGNFDGRGQYQDRDQILVAHTASVGTVLCNVHASNDLVDQGAGTANPFTAGTTWSIITNGVYYSFENPNPWAPNGRYSVTTNGDGSGTLKVAGTLTAGVVDYVQLRATAPDGTTVSDARYPVIVT